MLRALIEGAEQGVVESDRDHPRGSVTKGLSSALAEHLDVVARFRLVGPLLENGSPIPSAVESRLLDATWNVQDRFEPGYGGTMLSAVACGQYASVADCVKVRFRAKGVVAPDPELAARYEAKYHVWHKLYPALRALEPELAAE